jgi:hypothetical protein
VHLVVLFIADSCVFIRSALDFQKMKSTLQIISEAMVSESLDLLLIGGYGLQAYGVVRQTMDVDCLISQGDRDKLDAALRDAGYESAGESDNFRRYRSESLYLMDIDVLFVDGGTMAKLSAEVREFRLQNQVFRVPSMIHLIALKLHGIKNDTSREARDISDVIELLRLNAGEVPRKDLEDACRRYGPEGIFAKLENYRP